MLLKRIEVCEQRARDLGLYEAKETAEAKAAAEDNAQTAAVAHKPAALFLQQEPQSLSQFLAAEEEGLHMM